MNIIIGIAIICGLIMCVKALSNSKSTNTNSQRVIDDLIKNYPELTKEVVESTKKKEVVENIKINEKREQKLREGKQRDYNYYWNTAVDYYQEGIKTNNIKCFITSKEIAERAVRECPDNVTSEIYGLIASNAFMLNNYFDALEYCDKAFSLDEQSRSASITFSNAWNKVQQNAIKIINSWENIENKFQHSKIVELLRMIGKLQEMEKMSSVQYTILADVVKLRMQLQLFVPEFAIDESNFKNKIIEIYNQIFNKEDFEETDFDHLLTYIEKYLISGNYGRKAMLHNSILFWFIKHRTEKLDTEMFKNSFPKFIECINKTFVSK